MNNICKVLSFTILLLSFVGTSAYSMSNTSNIFGIGNPSLKKQNKIINNSPINLTIKDSDPIGTDETVIIGTYAGIFKLNKDRVHWTKAAGTENKSWFQMIKIKKNVFLAMADGDGIWKSVDDGDTWYETSNEVSGRAITILKNGNILAEGRQDLYISKDDGETWEKSIPSNEQWFSLFTLPDGDLLGCNFGSGIIRSTDNGKTWIPTNLDYYYCYSFLILQDKNTILSAAADLGVYRSHLDDIDNWTHLDTRIGFGVWDSIDQDNEGRIVAANTNGYDGGNMAYSNDNGDNWSKSTNLSLMWNFIKFLKNGDALAGTSTETGLLISRDDGLTWQATELNPGQYVVSILVEEK